MKMSRPFIISLGAGALAAIATFAVVSTSDTRAVAQERAEREAVAVFAGGCFWCIEADFDKLDGVIETISGYTGGSLDNPTYRDVVYKDTGHYEALKVVYDAAKVDYETLVEYFWRHVDPTDAGGQFCDRGDSYRTAIFTETEEEAEIAEASKTRIETSGVLPAGIVTPILDASTFWPAEDYHQDYYKKNPVRYSIYRSNCGRDARVRAVWSKEKAGEGT